MEVCKSENPIGLTHLLAQDHAKVDSLAMSWMPSDQVYKHLKLQDMVIQITFLVNTQVIQLSLKDAVTLASTVIHRSGTDMEKQFGGRIKNNG